MNANGTCSILRVDHRRWEQAQQWERTLWERAQRHRGARRLLWPLGRLLLGPLGARAAHRDDWNHWWASQFANYQFLPKRLESFIELGCGPYTNARIILGGRTADRVVLSDPLMDTYVDFTGNWLHQQHRRGTIEIDSHPIETLPFPDASFEVVALINVLDHVQDAMRCLRRAAGLVKEQGFLLLGQDLSDDVDIQRVGYDIGHPIRIDLRDIDPCLRGFEPILRRVLLRAEGRNESAHYATLIFAGQKCEAR